MTGNRVVVIGDALIDELRDERGSRSFPGGAALNVAVGLRLLGAETTLVAMLGDDEDAVEIRGHLARWDVRLVSSFSRFGTSRAVSDRRGGEPTYAFNEAAQRRHIDFGPLARAAIDAADYVVVSCYPFDRDDEASALAAAVADPGRRLVLDPNPRAGMMSDRGAFVRNLEAAAAESFLVKVGDEDAALLYSADLAAVQARLHGLGAGVVLGTAGPAGASVVADELRVDVPVAELPGPIVDTMGAGDATLASVITSLLGAGLPADAADWEAVLRRAMLVAAATCRAEGALLRLPEALAGPEQAPGAVRP